MDKKDLRYSTYVSILREELVPAMGCTEPIALAYAAAKAREVLGAIPEKVEIKASGSIIKNVKSVIVPNTDRLKGMEAAAAAGIIGGKAEKQLEVIADVTEDQKQQMRAYLDTADISVDHVEDGHVFDIIISEYAGDNYVTVRISDYHTNIVLIEKNHEILYSQEVKASSGEVRADRNLLTLEGIWDFALSVDLDDVSDVLERQLNYNSAIAMEGLKGNWGSNIGSLMLDLYGNDVKFRARAMAAAGSDARMNGCELPVIINCGSGNQGITCSMPILEFAKESNCGKEKMLRALIISDLIAVHIKHGIGTLSAFCGAVSASAGAGAGIAYILGGDFEAACATAVNTLANVAGIVCDGAKASCAAKIASSVDAAIMGYHMHLNGNDFCAGDGIVLPSDEDTICGVGKIGKDGMRNTNEEIIKIMIRK